MNPDTNKFEKLIDLNKLNKDTPLVDGTLLRPNGDPVPKHWSTFVVGENYVINDYTFKCAYIGETSILFEPVGIVEF